MRLHLTIMAMLLSLPVAAQPPPSSETKRFVPEPQLKELYKKGEVEIDRCTAALWEIDDEKAASDRVIRRDQATLDLKQQYEQEMYYADKRIKAIDAICLPARKARDLDFGPSTFNGRGDVDFFRRSAIAGNLEMNRKACAIIAKDCKPRKHW